MLKGKLKRNLTLEDVGLSSEMKKCIVCDRGVSNSTKLILIDTSDEITGWVCPHCTSLFDSEDNLLDLGDLGVYSEIRGYS